MQQDAVAGVSRRAAARLRVAAGITRLVPATGPAAPGPALRAAIDARRTAAAIPRTTTLHELFRNTNLATMANLTMGCRGSATAA